MSRSSDLYPEDTGELLNDFFTGNHVVRFVNHKEYYGWEKCAGWIKTGCRETS